ncbi:MAG: glycosyltransferase [Planctomycetaceae bacterium]|nr:glycosyltransferase [Planctomycetaceae bacterium]
MKILLCHDYYQQPGGEDLSFAAEAALLEHRGHDVIRYTVHNDAVDAMSRWQVAARTIWSRESYRAVRRLIRQSRPDVMHCTNTFPLLSPSIYYAARAEGVPVVQSLRNYRLLCPGAYFLRDGKVCEDCLGRAFAWPAMKHGCYRDSRSATAVVATMSTVHRFLGTWTNAVNLFFTPSEFARGKFLKAGFPEDKVAVKPNFIDPDPGSGDGQGDTALFVGRLSPEKGIETLLAAWQILGSRLPLQIVGDGPLRNIVEQAAAGNAAISYLGSRPHAEVLELMGRARCVIMPSIWYETFGRTIIEAFAKGTPVIASRLGCMEELVDDGETGQLFAPGDPVDLAAAVMRLLDYRTDSHLSRNLCRQAFLTQYTADRNYQMLLDLYDRAGSRLDHSRHPVDQVAEEVPVFDAKPARTGAVSAAR